MTLNLIKKKITEFDYLHCLWRYHNRYVFVGHTVLYFLIHARIAIFDENCAKLVAYLQYRITLNKKEKKVNKLKRYRLYIIITHRYICVCGSHVLPREKHNAANTFFLTIFTLIIRIVRTHTILKFYIRDICMVEFENHSCKIKKIYKSSAKHFATFWRGLMT